MLRCCSKQARLLTRVMQPLLLLLHTLLAAGGIGPFAVHTCNTWLYECWRHVTALDVISKR